MAKDFEQTVLQALSNLQTDVSGLKTDVSGLQTDVSSLKSDVRRLEVLHEETAEKIDQIIEIVSPELERGNIHDLTLQDHEQRITLLEKTA